ncbi:MAG: cobalamin-dependent protein [Planctomycetes bacterium]|nr:cobalamin-dependent protein [Planctomycetota bacterium]
MNILYVVRDMSFIEPLGVMFLSAVARQDGHESSLGIINEEDVLQKVARDHPDMVCMSVMSVDGDAFKALATKIKERCADVIIVVGGSHATFETNLRHTWPVDAVIQGEGDWAFRDLVRAVDAGEPFDGIANVHTRTATNPMRRLIDRLDDLPHPDRELVVTECVAGFAEANLGMASEVALAEAERCFNCGVCNECDLCLLFCPDIAITHGLNGDRYLIDMDYCKGCGICAAECPRGAMAMTRVGQ